MGQQAVLEASPSKVRSASFLILLLGALSLITPFSVDMYLPAFGRIAAEFHTTTSAISLSLSTYFVGFALGQVFYGPLLDRFGRKRPIYVGLSIYIAASLGCIHPGSLRVLIALRFLQAVAGCAAQVGAVAMVRDFFPADQSARVFSLIFLVIGVSPLLAPSMGSLIMLWFGWPAIFVALALFATLTLGAIAIFLPEGHVPDRGFLLQPMPLLLNYGRILKQPQFCAYALAGAFSFAGLFAYVAGSPIIFMDGFRVSEKAFGVIFAVLTLGFIVGSQINILLLRRFNSERIFQMALLTQVALGVIFFGGQQLGWFGLNATLVLFFLFLSCIGLTYPNAAAIALAPFSRNVGSASALLGFIQMGTGALVSTGIGLLGSNLVVALLAGTAVLAAALLAIGRRFTGGRLILSDGTSLNSLH